MKHFFFVFAILPVLAVQGEENKASPRGRRTRNFPHVILPQRVPGGISMPKPSDPPAGEIPPESVPVEKTPARVASTEEAPSVPISKSGGDDDGRSMRDLREADRAFHDEMKKRQEKFSQTPPRTASPPAPGKIRSWLEESEKEDERDERDRKRRQELYEEQKAREAAERAAKATKKAGRK